MATRETESFAEKYRRIENRNRFVALVIERVERQGWCRVSTRPSGDPFDDPPEHWLVTEIRHFEEIEAARERRRPHLEAPRTLYGELFRVCRERGWECVPYPDQGMIAVAAPARDWDCGRCKGRGKIFTPQPVPNGPLDFKANQVIHFEVCGSCQGRGVIHSRVDPATALAGQPAGPVVSDP